MRFARSAPALIIATSSLVIIAITILAQLLTRRLVETAHAGDYDLMKRSFTSKLNEWADAATSDAELIANMPGVRKALIEKDRAKLLAECAKMYSIAEQKWAIDQAQFHLPPGVSFLRLHKPAAFGDDQTSYRPMLAEVHREKTIRKGTAITKAGPAIFGMIPMFDDAGNFVGSFEMGLEFGPVLDNLKTAYSLEGAVFFQENQLREIATDLPGDVISQKNRVGKYIRYHATHPELAAALVTDKDVEVTEPKHFERVYKGTPWGVQLLPLYNYANKQIGVVALAMSFDEDKTLARRALVWQVLAGIFAVVFMAGIVLVVVRGVLLAPLASLNERMRALATGDGSKPPEPNDTYCDELKELAENYERIRTQREP